MKRLRILFNLAGDALKASSRVRGYWIAEELEVLGHWTTCMQVSSRLDLLRLGARIATHDVVVFQKVYGRYDPILVRWARFLNKQVVFDIDDAPSRVSDPLVEQMARRMMHESDKVFAGCTALVDLASKVQPNTHLIPSSIRLDTYRPSSRRRDGDLLCLGWIGNGTHYAEDLVSVLAPALQRVAVQTPLRFRIVGACGDTRLYNTFGNMPGLYAEFVDIIDWADSNAVNAEIAKFDIGLYPLRPGPFNDFKCGFKALEYMAMSLPVLASDAANHAEIIEEGVSGFLLKSEEDWVAALHRLIVDADLIASFGIAGREIIETRFSTALVAHQMTSILLESNS